MPPQDERVVVGGKSCQACAMLLTAPWLLDAAATARSSEESAQYLQKARITFAQLEMTSERRKRARDETSLVALDRARLLASAQARVQLHTQLLHAMADGNVPRLSALIGAALRANRGPAAIVRMLQLAKEGKYHAKGFSLPERDVMLLVLRLGHRGLAFAVAKALGLPSITTALNHSAHLDVAGVIVSHSSLGVEDRLRELLHRAITRAQSSYEAAGTPFMPLFSLVNDATVVTAGAGCDNGYLSGLCQCCSVNVNVHDYDSIVNIANAVKSGQIHLAKNLDVYGLVDLFGGHHGIEELHVQGVCGSADAPWHARTTTIIQTLWREGAYEGKYGPLVHVAHDGAAPMRAAFELRRASCESASQHPRMEAVRQLLKDLPGFDLRTDAYGTTDLYDLRHIIKRILTDWVANGVQVASVFVSTSMLRTIVAAGMGRARYAPAVNVLFEPFDKMRVPAALRFLDALAAFSPARPDGNALAFTELHREASGSWASDKGVRQAIELVGLWSSLATATVDNLEVLETLTRVSAFAHLTLVLQLASPRKDGTASRFVTTELNYDIQASAVATYQHVATCVAASAESKKPVVALLYLEGSDKLEEKFATCRRVRTTFSMEQVKQVLQSAADASDIISRHPNWRRRDIRRDIKDTKSGARTDDHIGRADVDRKIAEVTASHGWKLPSAWNAGKVLAENACIAAMQLKGAAGKKAATGLSFTTGSGSKRANMFFYVFKQLGVEGSAHEKKSLVCPLVAGQPLGVKAAAKAPAAPVAVGEAPAANADAGEAAAPVGSVPAAEA